MSENMTEPRICLRGRRKELGYCSQSPPVSPGLSGSPGGGERLILGGGDNGRGTVC